MPAGYRVSKACHHCARHFRRATDIVTVNTDPRDPEERTYFHEECLRRERAGERRPNYPPIVDLEVAT